MRETSSISDRSAEVEDSSEPPAAGVGSGRGFTRTLPLGRWVFLWILLISVLALSVTLAVVVAALKSDLTARLEERGRSAIRAATDGRWEATGGVVLLSALPELVAGEVRDGRDRLVWQYGPLQEIRQDPQSDALVINETQTGTSELPEDDLHITLVLSTGPINHYVLASGLRLTVSLSLVLALGLLGGTLLINRVVEPLNSVARAVGSFDPTAPVELPTLTGGGREVHEVARAFHRMSHRLVAQRQELAASERRFRDLFENSPVALLEVRGDGVIVGINPAARSLVGSRFHDVGRSRLDDFLPGAGDLLRSAHGAAGGLTTEAAWCFSSGDESEVEVHLQEVAGSPDGMVLVAVRDLSDRLRRLGERWQATLDEMDEGVALLGSGAVPLQTNRAFGDFAHAVLPRVEAEAASAERAEWTQVANHRSLRCVVAPVTGSGERVLVVRDETDWLDAEEQLREARKMEAVATLAGGVAHDFNNLLAGILLHLRVVEKDPSAADEAVATIRSLAEEGAEVVKGLIDFANPQPGPRGAVDVAALVTEQERILRHMLPESIALACRVTVDEASVLGNPGALRRILLNLVLNARDALDEAAGKIDVEVSRSETQVILSVEDDGPGIPMAVRDRIFEPFFSLRREGRGSGLGLAVTYALVEEHDGTISYENGSAGGARFVVRLPRHSHDVADANVKRM